MNVTEAQAQHKLCPIMSAGKQTTHCEGSACMMWQWDEALMLNPPDDSYISEPGPTGHCGLTAGEFAK